MEHLVLDLFGRVGQEDGGVGVAGAHLGLSSLQRREEGGVKQSRFGKTDPRSHVPRHPEIRVLRSNQFQNHILEPNQQKLPISIIFPYYYCKVPLLWVHTHFHAVCPR